MVDRIFLYLLLFTATEPLPWKTSRPDRSLNSTGPLLYATTHN